MSRRALRAGIAIVAALAAIAAHARWAVEYEQDFSRGGLDLGRWTFESGYIRNQEEQFYTAANVLARDGALVIEARREAAAAVRGRRTPYTSGAIVLREPVHYGRIEVVARSPSGKGVWPAIWLVNEGAREYGEIDLYEAVGKHPDTVFGAVHFGRTAGTRQHRGGSIVVPGFEKSWRTHALEWSPERIVITMDGREVFAFDPRVAATGGLDPLRRPMKLHINLALGGNWGAAIDDAALPARFEIRSLRIMKWVDDGTEAAPAPAPAQAAAASLAPPAPAPEPPAEPIPMRWGR